MWPGGNCWYHSLGRGSQCTSFLVVTFEPNHKWWYFDLPTFFLPFTFILCFHYYINRYINSEMKTVFLLLWKYKLQSNNIQHRLFCFDIFKVTQIWGKHPGYAGLKGTVYRSETGTIAWKRPWFDRTPFYVYFFNCLKDFKVALY